MAIAPSQAKDSTVLQSVLVSLVADAIKERPDDLLDYMVFWGGLHNPDNYRNAAVPTGPYAALQQQQQQQPEPQGYQPPPPPAEYGVGYPHSAPQQAPPPPGSNAGAPPPPPQPQEQQPKQAPENGLPPRAPASGGLPPRSPLPTGPPAAEPPLSEAEERKRILAMRGGASVPRYSMPVLTDLPPPAGMLSPKNAATPPPPAGDDDDDEDDRPDTAGRMNPKELEAAITRRLFRLTRRAKDIADGAKDSYMMALEDSGYGLEMLRDMETHMNDAREQQHEYAKVEELTGEKIEQLASLPDRERADQLRQLYRSLPRESELRTF